MADWTVRLHDKIIKSFSIREGDVITIGRGSECNVTIDNTAISRRHVSLALNSGIYFVSDLGSTNGTFVNGKKITTDELLSETDTVEFGKFILASAQEEFLPKQAAVSVSSDPMDMDDETIFVTKKNKAQQKKQFKPRISGPKIVVIQGKATPRELALAGSSSIKIGKDQTCDLIVPGWFVAAAQCYIIKRENRYFLVPQKSWAGTYINNSKITAEHPLLQGDVIKIRGTTIRFD